DRSRQSNEMIVHAREIERLATHRLLLQRVRGAVQLLDTPLGSVFVFAAQRMPRIETEWDYCDDVDSLCVGCRIGRVGLIASLADGGALQPMEDQYSDLIDLPLHPLQFREIFSQVAYAAKLRNRTPKYVTMEGNPHTTIQLPLGGLSLSPLFRP